ncbi:hypothetical protein GCM10022255_058570 [Dactylosporangium darangshiense]|uniref:Chitin-binding type-3 domain-containing protein n=1 Tax=Dactylosporangium darangshiense TaxID=579108 RepID=A0ABP8DEV8_9ACTN
MELAQCRQFDIMESVNGANRTWQTMHCGTSPGGVCSEKSGVGNGGPSGCTPTACTKGMHRYTLDWSRADNSATWYVDGRQVWRTQRGGNIDPAAWDAATNHGFFILLNLAMGGEMPCNTLGCLGSGTGGGGHMDVDYVAAYTGPANAPPPALGPGDGTGTSPTPGPSTCGPLISQGRPTTSSGNENGTARGTVYGYSLWEFQVYGACGTSPSPPAGTSSPPGASTPPPGQYPAWAPNTAYHVSDRVSYAGLAYECRQAHTSIVTWEPPNTPALWLQF